MILTNNCNLIILIHKLHFPPNHLQYFLQFKELNSSVATLLHAFDAAPFLKTLPEEVSNVQNKVAQFGSRLTDLETQFAKSETDLKSDLNELKHNLAEDDKVTNRVIV